MNTSISLPRQALLATNKDDVIKICTQAYRNCIDNTETIKLLFPGFSVNFIHKINKEAELVLITNIMETHYQPDSEWKVIEFLNGRFR